MISLKCMATADCKQCKDKKIIPDTAKENYIVNCNTQLPLFSEKEAKYKDLEHASIFGTKLTGN